MTMSRVCLVLALALGGLVAAVAQADYYYSARQYYGPWNKAPGYSYHYRKYYYKPSYSYSGYKHNYVVHYPTRPKYHYYYNPYKKTYWGRCPSTYGSDYNGQGAYSLLAPPDRHSQLAQIPENAFPAPTAPPPIPESTDNVPLDLPPDDLPEGVKSTITAPVGE